MGRKRRFFTRRTDFALISRVFIHQSCNFTRMSPAHTKISCFLLTNLQKCLEIILLLLQSESKCKSIFFSLHFCRKSNSCTISYCYILSESKDLFVTLINKCCLFQCAAKITVIDNTTLFNTDMDLIMSHPLFLTTLYASLFVVILATPTPTPG